jgi:hypothetical protein
VPEEFEKKKKMLHNEISQESTYYSVRGTKIQGQEAEAGLMNDGSSY